jgi:hypothetical protein
VTGLTDRMRTCAAFIQARPNDAPMPTEHLLDDAAALLITAAAEIELLNGPVNLGEPMQIIEQPKQQPKQQPQQHQPLASEAVWIGDDLKPLANVPQSRNACPNCDSRAQKTVYREGKQLVLECPVCGSRWKR